MRTQWARWCALAGDAARVLDRPLVSMAERAWVGGGAPAFEEELAGRRERLRALWERVLGTMAEYDAAVRAGARTESSNAVLAPGTRDLPALGVPSVRTGIAVAASSAGQFTGVDLDGLRDLMRQLAAAGRDLNDVCAQLPASGVPARGPVLVLGSLVGEIETIARWSSGAGLKLAGRLELAEAADAAAVRGLTAAPGLAGPLISAGTAGQVVFGEPAEPKHSHDGDRPWYERAWDTVATEVNEGVDYGEQVVGAAFAHGNELAVDVALTAGGMLLVDAGAAGEVGGALLDATGVGALVGVPVNVASAASKPDTTSRPSSTRPTRAAPAEVRGPVSLCAPNLYARTILTPVRAEPQSPFRRQMMKRPCEPRLPRTTRRESWRDRGTTWFKGRG